MQDKRQMKLLGVGDAVGGQGMVAPGVYASTIRAVSDVRAYRLPVKVYKQLLVYLRQKKQVPLLSGPLGACVLLSF